MEAENVALDDCGQREVVEERSKVLPDISISILPKTLVIKSVNLCDLLALVVSSKDSDSVWVSDLKCDQQGNGLD
jgi:hypothetical protein